MLTHARTVLPPLTLVLAVLAACSSAPDAGALDAGGDSATACAGSAPNCFGDDLQACCGNDPSGVAACVGGAWMCGGAAAPGCDGTSCLAHDGGAADASDASSEGSEGSDGGCTGTKPNCFGNDVASCCGQDPSGQAMCVGNAWMCGAAPAPGCNGTSCLLHDSGTD